MLVLIAIVLCPSFYGQTKDAVPQDSATGVARLNTPVENVQLLPAGAKTAWNTVCPVMDEDVDPALPTLQYKGKVIGVCCNVCLKKFKQDPEKYFSRLTEDGKAIKGKDKEN